LKKACRHSLTVCHRKLDVAAQTHTKVHLGNLLRLRVAGFDSTPAGWFGSDR
jgi:hypothetical protein